MTHTLHTGDCLEVLAGMEPCSVDTVITRWLALLRLPYDGMTRKALLGLKGDSPFYNHYQISERV